MLDIHLLDDALLDEFFVHLVMRVHITQHFLQMVRRKDFSQHIEDLASVVGIEGIFNFLDSLEQLLQHSAFAGIGGNEVKDEAVFLLPVAVDAAHALFQANGVPGYVVVDHQPAELEIDAFAGLVVSEQGKGQHMYSAPRIPRHLWRTGEQLEPRFGKLGREYKQFVFDKEILKAKPTAEWVTPGHPLFETVRESLTESVRGELEKGAVFFDVHRSAPARLYIYSAAIHDGLGHVLHRRLFIIQEQLEGTLSLRQPTLLLDLVPAPAVNSVPDAPPLDRNAVEHFLVEQGLQSFLSEITAERAKEIKTVREHLDLSLNELIHRQNLKLAELVSASERGETSPLLAANIKQAEDRVDELMARLESRHLDLEKEQNCTIGDIQRHAVAWVLPHPERTTPSLAAMVRDDEIEHIAVDAVIAYERTQGREVESVEKDNRGFDLISRRPHPEDPQTAIEVRFIEVKGRSAVGEVALTANEYRTAQRLKKDYWLYTVFDCATQPRIHIVRDPAQMDWQPIVKIEHYQVKPQAILDVSESPETMEDK